MDDILKLPKEEQEKYFIPWETLKKELEIWGNEYIQYLNDKEC